MKKILALLLFAAFIFSAVSCTETPDGPVTGADTKPAQTASPATEAPSEAPTEALTEKATEAATEKVTEEPTEKVTEALTEKVTEAATEKATEAATEKVTEPETELIPGDYESVLVKEKYFSSENVLLHEYRYEDELRMEDLYYYGDGAFMCRIEYIYDGSGRLMGTVTYNEQGSVSESAEITYETMQEVGDITTRIKTTKTYNAEHITTSILAESRSYDKNGVLLYGSDMDTYLIYNPEQGTYQEDTAYGTAYEYGSDGLLARETVTSLGMKTITTYSYDYEGTLIRVDISNEGVDIKPIYRIYDYTDGGLLIKVTVYEEDGSVRTVTNYDYNQFYQTEKEMIYDDNGMIVGRTEYEYKLVEIIIGVG